MEENNSVAGQGGNKQENLRVENDFMKMKMMLEYGADFGSSKDLPPEIENKFLRSVMEFEKQFECAETIKIFDKLGQPTQFRPVAEISEEDIEHEWLILYECLNEHGIELSVCSPNVNARELYRFTTEELFGMETDAISMPGMTCWYIYDEFHPDHQYENKRIAVEECIAYFFNKEAYYDHHFADRIRVNAHRNLSKAELKYLLQSFKNDYDQIVPVRIEAKDCRLNKKRCLVTGKYEVVLIINDKSSVKQGDWSVGFQVDKKIGFWYISNVQISGIKIG